ncbi:Cyclic AMP receptor-like protein A isoform X2 [Oopsacas minuta]|uniref:Cyclic AMP receptor-like protein A isoform X2 n=1 Tax=Oopsacas minuta TaxID=111878 RepID=A0AAV7KFF4_9METZ|nr:Cyclic AMP receptor-like protein A isoform X2 [Oopsacas minuta]
MVNITNNCLFQNYTEYCTIVEVTVRSISVLSAVCAIIVLVLIFLIQRYKFVSQRLILYLVISTLLDAITLALGGLDLSESAACTAEGFFRMLLRWNLVVWVCSITVNLFWNVVVGRRSNRYLEIGYVIFGVVIPIGFSVFPFINSSYGPAGIWCWITNKTYAGKILRFGIWYVPLWIIIGGIFIIFLIIIVKLLFKVKRWTLYNSQNDKKKDKIRNEIKSLFLYPIFFLVINIFPIANRIQNVIVPNHPLFPLYLLHAISTPLLGLGFTMLFVVNKDTLRDLKWSNFKTTLLTRFKSNSTGKIKEIDVEGTTKIDEHTVVIKHLA